MGFLALRKVSKQRPSDVIPRKTETTYQKGNGILVIGEWVTALVM